jgi:hypothetical protein
MTGPFDPEISTARDAALPGRTAGPARVLELLRTLTDGRRRTFRPVRPFRAPPAPANPAAGLPAAVGFAPTGRAPRSDVVRSACGLPSFLGLLSLDGTLLEFNHTAATPPERDLQHAVDRPFWEATWWSWSPLVQQRLRAAVAQVVGGRTLRYPETALVRRTQLITMDLAWAPLISSGTVAGVLCSATEIIGRERPGPGLAPR